jgi:hypothetical protein
MTPVCHHWQHDTDWFSVGPFFRTTVGFGLLPLSMRMLTSTAQVGLFLSQRTSRDRGDGPNGLCFVPLLNAHDRAEAAKLPTTSSC